MNETELYKYFENNRFNKKENQTRSFTYWSFLYDMLIENRIDEESNIYDQLRNTTRYETNYSKKLENKINSKIIAEILDISILQEIAEDFIFWHN